MMLVLTVVLPRDDPHRPADESRARDAAGLDLARLRRSATCSGSAPPSVALVGGIALGLLVLPYLWSLWQSRP